jgi:hypothetical protein
VVAAGHPWYNTAVQRRDPITTEQPPHLEPGAGATPQQVTPARIEQIIDRISARHLADLRALREELRQPVQTTEREREPLAVLPSACAQPQNIQQAQVKTSRSGVPTPALLLPPPAAAPPAHAAPAPQRQLAHVPAPVAPPPVRPQRRTGAERLEARTVHPFYWALLYGVVTLISLGLGILIPIILVG